MDNEVFAAHETYGTEESLLQIEYELCWTTRFNFSRGRVIISTCDCLLDILYWHENMILETTRWHSSDALELLDLMSPLVGTLIVRSKITNWLKNTPTPILSLLQYCTVQAECLSRDCYSLEALHHIGEWK